MTSNQPGEAPQSDDLAPAGHPSINDVPRASRSGNVRSASSRRLGISAADGSGDAHCR